MSLRINDEAPDFTAETTEGTIRFHDWIGDGWAVLFSHPADFTPVCTTELGYMAKLEPEFTKRNCKIIGLSVDPLEDHLRWSEDIAETLVWFLVGAGSRLITGETLIVDSGILSGPDGIMAAKALSINASIISRSSD